MDGGHHGVCGRALGSVSLVSSLNNRPFFNLPHALQILWPCSSRLHSGVIVVPQLWHAITTAALASWLCEAATSISLGLSTPSPSIVLLATLWGWKAPPPPMTVLLAILLLYAGHPLQPTAPPIPLQRPPPGHVPRGISEAASCFAAADELDAVAPCELLLATGEDLSGCILDTVVGGLFKLVGRAAFLAFRYRPQALQMVAPCGDLRQRGVRLVPQLLCENVSATGLQVRTVGFVLLPSFRVVLTCRLGHSGTVWI